MTSHIGIVEVIAVLALIVFVGVMLAWFDSPLRNRGRYSGPVYDPQRPVVRRAGAVGYTGVKCPLCFATTFGNSPRCGKCGRLNVQPRVVRTESTARLTLVERK
jgi:hypothetical protein